MAIGDIWKPIIDSANDELEQMHIVLHSLTVGTPEHDEQYRKILEHVENMRRFSRFAFSPVGLADYPD